MLLVSITLTYYKFHKVVVESLAYMMCFHSNVSNDYYLTLQFKDLELMLKKA